MVDDGLVQSQQSAGLGVLLFFQLPVLYLPQVAPVHLIHPIAVAILVRRVHPPLPKPRLVRRALAGLLSRLVVLLPRGAGSKVVEAVGAARAQRVRGRPLGNLWEGGQNRACMDWRSREKRGFGVEGTGG